MATARVSVPASTWIFLAVAVLVLIVVMVFGMRRAAASRATRRTARAGKGLSAEQQAFQDEMRLMLEVRLRERYSSGEDTDGPDTE